MYAIFFNPVDDKDNFYLMCNEIDGRIAIAAFEILESRGKIFIDLFRSVIQQFKTTINKPELDTALDLLAERLDDMNFQYADIGDMSAKELTNHRAEQHISKMQTERFSIHGVTMDKAFIDTLSMVPIKASDYKPILFEA